MDSHIARITWRYDDCAISEYVLAESAIDSPYHAIA